MDTVANLQKELESCLGSINSAGLDKLDSQNIEKLEQISAATDGLGMKQGKKLIDNLCVVLKAFKEEKSTGESVSLRLTALDFYLQNTKGGDTEDL
ncbi:hypothetical protein AGMMS50293_12230 [Spirochaetia bacterium]|nr:hypothetical protein AGMMS50293_12230 [Spirochaetia bacterium]